MLKHTICCVILIGVDYTLLPRYNKNFFEIRFTHLCHLSPTQMNYSQFLNRRQKEKRMTPPARGALSEAKDIYKGSRDMPPHHRAHMTYDLKSRTLQVPLIRFNKKYRDYGSRNCNNNQKHKVSDIIIPVFLKIDCLMDKIMTFHTSYQHLNM